MVRIFVSWGFGGMGQRTASAGFSVANLDILAISSLRFSGGKMLSSQAEPLLSMPPTVPWRAPVAPLITSAMCCFVRKVRCVSGRQEEVQSERGFIDGRIWCRIRGWHVARCWMLNLPCMSLRRVECDEFAVLEILIAVNDILKHRRCFQNR